MRHWTVRRLAQGLALLGAAGTLGGCGLLGGNTDQICTDTKQAFQEYVTQVKSASAADPAQWKQATDQLAGRIDGLAGKADDGKVRSALQAEVKRLRSAAASVGTGDAAQLNRVLSDTPQRIGKVCS
jgi:hypothetical protein